MNVNSSGVSSYWAQMQSNSKVQSQSSASGMAPKGDYGSLMQQIDASVMSMLDTNQNGSIDKTEFSDMAKQLSQGQSVSSNTDKAFAAIDSNGDGSITADELMKMLEQLSTKHKAHKMSARAQESIINQTTQTNEESSTHNMQSVLMKNILSAYSSTHVATNTTGVNLKA